MNAAAELGFEYVLWDEHWDTWPAADLDFLLNWAKSRGVGVWLWKRWTTLETPAQREAFFGWIDGKNRALGEKIIVGVKIDFMDSESQARMAWYEATLRDAADHELMINFHGANKPTGQARTYPHEMTREGIRGLEHNILGNHLAPAHNAALPFTRLLGGHADYTPAAFLDNKLGNTTYAQQLAMAFVLTSPLTHWADHPDRYLNSPAREVIEASPTVWDETMVLEGSEVGRLAAMSRRAGSRWFVAVVNGDAANSTTLPVSLSFLNDRPRSWGATANGGPRGLKPAAPCCRTIADSESRPGGYRAVLLGDLPSSPYGFNRSTAAVRATDTLNIWLRPGGGFVGMFTRAD